MAQSQNFFTCTLEHIHTSCKFVSHFEEGEPYRVGRTHVIELHDAPKFQMLADAAPATQINVICPGIYIAA